MFPSFVGGGFECSTHRRPDGRRLDLIAATGHDVLARDDYDALAATGLAWARDGLRWHLIETRPGQHDWRSWDPLLAAADTAGVDVWWDIIHFGFPDDCPPMAADFVARAADLAHAAALHQRRMTGRPGRFCVVNETSFLAFAAGEMGWFGPHLTGQGHALKTRLVQASIAMSHAIRAADPSALLMTADPLINVMPRHEDEAAAAAAWHESQFEALDWLLGRSRPELGGSAGLVDVIGFNHYPHNQWWAKDGPVAFGAPFYEPLSRLLVAAATRYPDTPFVLSETGAEGPARAPWLYYIRQEAELAITAGVPLLGACLYPVTDYPGWDDDRPCPTGLFGLPSGGRRVVEPRVLGAARALETMAHCLLGGTSGRASWLHGHPIGKGTAR